MKFSAALVLFVFLAVAASPAIAQMGGFSMSYSAPSTPSGISDTVSTALNGEKMPSECADIKSEADQLSCIKSHVSAKDEKK
jgi:hypothetical protein